MTYRWLTDLDQVFAAAGVPYVEVGPSEADYTGSASWRERGRPASTGEFDPAGVLCHHTASPAGTSDQADLNGILWGNSQAPGPVSTLYIGRTGVLYLVAAGRCNHGGQGMRPGIDGSCADMNAALLGIEAGNSGVGEFWPDVQIATYTATVAALVAGYGWDWPAVYLHGQTGPPGGGCNSKIDPAGPWAGQPDLVGSTMWDVELWREWCANAGPPDSITPPSTVEATERRRAMSDFVIIYGIPDVADGTVLEIVQGHKRHVAADEWWEVLKGVVMAPDGSVPVHHPWQPVAFVTNGYYALSLPDFDTATGLAVPTLSGPPP
jgi:hypothetical protein